MNVLNLLEERSIKYIDSGKDYVVSCINPEHEDSNPSMRVDKISGVYHCFSCGYKGNLFTKYGAEPNLTDIQVFKMQDKIKNLLSNTNISIPFDAVPFFEDYRGISKHIYAEANCFLTQEIEELKDRLCFPLYDLQGNIKAIIGRSTLSNISDKYYIYPKHVNLPIYPALPEIYKNTLIIVEGIFDVLNLNDKGCYNVICAFGTNTLLKTFKDKLDHFKILGVNKFFIMFDGDKAGQNAATKLEFQMNKNGYNSEIIELPEDTDPGCLKETDVKLLMTGLYGNENSSS